LLYLSWLSKHLPEAGSQGDSPREPFVISVQAFLCSNNIWLKLSWLFSPIKILDNVATKKCCVN
jgi:hypothetical protein